ncbi:MAG: hypothetical protein IT379_32705 [Deltaproteobacteria bacterium]|nr:hypothetical protein [Deltaproteobacteria bacterium]
MTRIKTLLTAFALSAPMVLGTGLASAQAYPQHVYVQPAQHAQPIYPQPATQPGYAQPGQPGYAQRGARPERRMRAQRVDKTGTVQSFLVSGRRIRGVTLTDGTTVLLRAGTNAQLRRLRPGALVRVRGYAVPGNASMIRDASLTALRVRQQLPAPPPIVTPAPLPPPVVTPAPAPAPVAVRSAIRSVQWAANGLPQMLILTNGRQIHLPTAIARPLAQRGIRIGESVAIVTHTAANGTLVADTLSFANGASFSANR